MRLLDWREMSSVVTLLPPELLNARDWSQVEGMCLRLRSDLHYFDVIDSGNFSRLPDILRKFGEERCFVVNLKLLREGQREGTAPAIVITSEDDSGIIRSELSNEGRFHLQYLSVFYLSGSFVIISSAKDWFLIAEADENALFTTDSELKFAWFQKTWWPPINVSQG